MIRDVYSGENYVYKHSRYLNRPSRALEDVAKTMFCIFPRTYTGLHELHNGEITFINLHGTLTGLHELQRCVKRCLQTFTELQQDFTSIRRRPRWLKRRFESFPPLKLAYTSFRVFYNVVKYIYKSSRYLNRPARLSETSTAVKTTFTNFHCT